MAGVCLIHGTDEFWVERRALEWLGVGNRWETIDGRWETAREGEAFLRTLADTMDTRSLFGAERVIWVRAVEFLGAAPAEEAQKTTADILAQCARARDLGVDLCISAFPVDRRLRVFKELCAMADVLEAFAGGDAAVEALVTAEASRRRLAFEDAAKRHFLAKVGTDGRSSLMELEKLDTYLGSRRTATVEDVRAVVCAVPRDEFFEVLEAFYGRNGRAFDVLLGQFFRSGGEFRSLLAAFQNQNRILLQMKALDKCPASSTPPDRSSLEMFSKNPWYLRRLRDRLPAFTLEELVGIQWALLDLFEASIRHWQEVTPEWLQVRFSALLPGARRAGCSTS